MRLIFDHSPGAAAVSVPCLTCGRMTRLADTVIDLDGPAFQAYYCPKHVPPGRPIAACDRAGCTRCAGNGGTP